MSKILQFVVYGKPEPQGSSKAFVRGGRAVITSDNPKMKGWRKEVGSTARASANDYGMYGVVYGKHVPVEMELRFRFMRPKSAVKSRMYPVVTPDLDKLQRAVLDALTGILYLDDAQVVKITASKVYDGIDGVVVLVREMLLP